MVYFLYGLAGLVAVILAILIIGALLPVKHVASRMVMLDNKPIEVWRFIRNFEAAPKWRDDVVKVKVALNDQGQEIWYEYSNETAFLAFETLEDIKPSRLVRKIVGENLDFGGTWTFELANIDGKTQLTITEHGEVYHIFFRVVSKFIIGHHRTMDQYIKSLN